MTINIHPKVLYDYLNLARSALTEEWSLANKIYEETGKGLHHVEFHEKEIHEIDNLIHEVRNHPDFLK